MFLLFLSSVVAGISFSDEAKNCSGDGFGFQRRGYGRSATSLRGTGAREGSAPFFTALFGGVGKDRVRGLFGGGWHVSGDTAYASSREGVRV